MILILQVSPSIGNTDLCKDTQSICRKAVRPLFLLPTHLTSIIKNIYEIYVLSNKLHNVT